MTAESIYRIILHNQKQYYSPKDKADYEPLLMNPFAFNERTVKGVIELTEVEFVQVSDNIALMLGITAEKAQSLKMSDFFEAVSPQQLTILPQMVEWVYQTLTTCQTACVNITCCVSGLTLQRVGKPDKHLLVQLQPLEMLPNELPKFVIFCLNDVTHLVKGGVFWARLKVYQENRVQIHTFKFPPACFEVGDLLSKREQEVLTYLVNGCESKEIAKKLFISVFTVNNHRKNMMARLGARDTTALIQLCQMAGILQDG
jgi:DNA-binding CsgD family transcriptional regulator